MTLDRPQFLALVGGKGTIRTLWSGRLLTDLSSKTVKARMPPKARAQLLGTVSGGGEAHSVSIWWVPGFGRRELIVESAKLGEIVARAEPVEPEPDPEPARASLFG